MSRLVLTISINSALAMAGLQSGTAWAQSQGSAGSQSTPQEGQVQLEEVVVSGIRQSLARSIEDKREADLISDTISSEDVGKFPVRNIGDALQRLTGVQLNRNWGEGSTILLRGLPSRMVSNMYNGRQLPSPQGARSLDYSILPAEFVSTLSIYKTPTADLPQAGLAGTVNIEPIKPLNLPRRTIALSATAVYDDVQDKAKPNVAGIYTDKFFDDTFGVMLGAALSKRAITNINKYDFWFEPRREVAPGANALYPNGLDVNNNGTYTDTYRLWHNAVSFQHVGTRDRKSLVGNLQWQPNGSFEVQGDFLYLDMRTESVNAGNQARFTNALGALSNTQVDENNNLIAADIDDTWLLNNSHQYDIPQVIRSGGIGVTWTPSDRWSIEAGASKGTAEQETTDDAFEAWSYTKMHYDFLRDSTFASFSYLDPNFDPLDPNNFYFDYFRQTKSIQNNDTDEFHSNIKFDTGWRGLETISFGANLLSNDFYGDGSRLFVTDIQALSRLTGQPVVNFYGRDRLSAAPFMSRSPINGLLSSYDGAAQFPRTYLYSDPKKFFSRVSIADLRAIPGALTRDSALDSRVDERVQAAYLRLDFRTDDNRWAGNLGLRYEKTRESSRYFGVNWPNVVYDPSPACDQICAQANPTLRPSILTTKDNEYGQWLPSMNLKYSFTEELIGRISASKQMTRPDLNVLMGGESAQMLQTPVNGGEPIVTINSGNPNIEPYLADAFDASLEWYFNEAEGLLSAAFFYKDVSNWVFTSLSDETRTIALAQGGTRDYTFLRTSPQNGGGVKIKGLELTYQQPLSFLPSPWDGFGIITNYTFVDAGDITSKATGVKTPVTGVSKNSYNASIYYEKPLFNVRLSYNFHEGRIEAVRDYWAVGPLYSKDYGQLDLAAGYKLTDFAELTFSVTNLLDDPDFIGYMKQGGYINNFQQEGRFAQLGVHFKF